VKVFIGWSGERSKAFAEFLHRVLRTLSIGVSPWVSGPEIEEGARWQGEWRKAVEETEYAVLCVTPEAARSPWLHFEAGAFAKGDTSRVVPLLIDMEGEDFDGPLRVFPSRVVDFESMDELLRFLAGASETSTLEGDEVTRAFLRWRPDFDAVMKDIREQADPSSLHTAREEPTRSALMEMLGSLSRRLSEIDLRLERMSEDITRERVPAVLPDDNHEWMQRAADQASKCISRDPRSVDWRGDLRAAIQEDLTGKILSHARAAGNYPNDLAVALICHGFMAEQPPATAAPEA
jgi:hypothetical protein